MPLVISARTFLRVDGRDTQHGEAAVDTAIVRFLVRFMADPFFEG